MEKHLYLIPVNISSDEEGQSTLFARPELIEKLKVIFAEDIRTARRYFRKAGYTGDLDNQHWITLQQDTPTENILEALHLVTPDAPAGIISEAGIPGIADPGEEVVSLAHELNIRVIPLPGPSSIFLALAASGLNGQYFTFHGYLPIHEKERERQLRLIENVALQTQYTQVFMETPYRNMQLFRSILKVCRNDSRLCIAADITGKKEIIKTMTVQSWRNQPVNLHKIPAIFLLNR